MSDARFDDNFEFEVPPNQALDAFYHPYVYAPASLVAGSVGTWEVAPT